MRMDAPHTVTVPSGMRFFTPLPEILLEKNPDLAAMVIWALNRVDRSRNTLFRQAIGDLRIKYE